MNGCIAGPNVGIDSYPRISVSQWVFYRLPVIWLQQCSQEAWLGTRFVLPQDTRYTVRWQLFRGGSRRRARRANWLRSGSSLGCLVLQRDSFHLSEYTFARRHDIRIQTRQFIDDQTQNLARRWRTVQLPRYLRRISRRWFRNENCNCRI